MKNILYFDIETNGLLDTLTTCHCMVIIENGVITKYRPADIAKGAERLLKALQAGHYICGHNIINFDIPALGKLFEWFKVDRKNYLQCLDTLVMARLIYGNIKDIDAGLLIADKLPRKFYGSHKLMAWGYRLGEMKGTYGEDTENAWEHFSEEMLDYNVQDVIVTQKLYEKLFSKKGFPQQAIDLEIEAEWLMSKQQRNGFTFNVFKAQELEQKLQGKYAILDAIIRKAVPPVPYKIFVPKRDNKKLGYTKGVPIQRYKDFNPNSRQQIEWLITEYYKYKPTDDDLYEKGVLKVDNETFDYLENTEGVPKELQKLSKVFSEFLTVSKTLGLLSTGKAAWLSLVKEDGRMHGSVNPCGAVTGRATHSYPNVAQVPAISHMFGKECRELFTAPEGWYQVGVDASGLELRCLAHFMAPYDDGAYAHEILNGDIHTANMNKAGLTDRNHAKRFIYAYLYGAGDEKLGKLIGGKALEGRRMRKRFLAATPALVELRAAINNALVAEEYRGRVTKWRRSFLRGLDGRPLHVRSIHSALNLLLQSAGALICKKWIIILEERLINLGYDHGKDFQYMAWVHDEEQIACRTKEIAEVVLKEAQEAMRDSQAFFDFRVQLDTDGKIGKNWAECH